MRQRLLPLFLVTVWVGCGGSDLPTRILDGADVDAVALDANDAPVDAPIDAEILVCGAPCGECRAGRAICDAEGARCAFPGDRLDRSVGLPPADVGNRQVFRPESYPAVPGRPTDQLQRASAAAAAVGGAVVLDRIYEIDTTFVMSNGVMYTGGGLRRACTPRSVLTQPLVVGDLCIHVSTTAGHKTDGITIIEHPAYGGVRGAASRLTLDSAAGTICSDTPFTFDAPVGAYVARVFAMVTTAPIYSTGVVIDSMLFDGGAACNDLTHAWDKNATMLIPGDVVIRNSVFVDTPAETAIICGGTIEGNIALDLGGSFVHKSCSAANIALDVVRDNYVDRSNQVGDQIMVHSEGVFTLSANSAPIRSSNNVYRHGREGVWGEASVDDDDIIATGDCYAHFARLITYVAGGDPANVQFNDVEMIDIGP